MIATILTLASGGSAGKEGPCAQIGAGLASSFASVFRFNDRDRRKLVICGISAGFASVFGTPIAGAIFGVEVLFVGTILYDVLMPSFIAGLIGYHMSAYLGVSYFHHALNFTPSFSNAFFARIVLSGIFFGACSFLLVETMECGRAVASKLGVPAAVKALVGGSALVLLAAVISPRYLGLGLDTIESALGGTPTPWYAPFAKMVFTSITLNFGGSGGIVTPVFFVGATAGNLLSHMLNLDGPTSAALGMVGLLAGATNTPIAASIMAVEMFGSAIAPYAAVACVISFIVTGHRSVYPSQVLAFKKSQLLDVETGSQIAQVQVKPRVVRSSLLGRVILNVHRLYDRRSGTPDQR